MNATTQYLSYSPFIGLAGFFFAIATYFWIVRQPAGNAKMIGIATLIESGSMTFLKKEYTILMYFLALVTGLLAWYLGPHTAICYVVGALASMTCGYVGMKAATKANVRTAEAAAKSGEGKALCMAFHGASVMGMSVASLGLLGVALLYLWLSEGSSLDALNGFAMGASSIALFARVGGGIYTKAADVGADLVGKVEAGIPEDDPRNPATIADNVGDNVGDTAGMGADIFESYVGSVIATMFIGSTLMDNAQQAIILPLLVITVGLLASLLGVLSMNALKGIGAGLGLADCPRSGIGGPFWRFLLSGQVDGFSGLPLRHGAILRHGAGFSGGPFYRPGHRVFHRRRICSGKGRGRGGQDRFCHQHYCRPGGGHVLLRSGHFSDCHRHLLRQPFCRPLRHRHRRRGHACHGGCHHDC